MIFCDMYIKVDVMRVDSNFKIYDCTTSGFGTLGRREQNL